MPRKDGGRGDKLTPSQPISDRRSWLNTYLSRRSTDPSKLLNISRQIAVRYWSICGPCCSCMTHHKTFSPNLSINYHQGAKLLVWLTIRVSFYSDPSVPTSVVVMKKGSWHRRPVGPADPLSSTSRCIFKYADQISYRVKACVFFDLVYKAPCSGLKTPHHGRFLSTIASIEKSSCIPRLLLSHSSSELLALSKLVH